MTIKNNIVFFDTKEQFINYIEKMNLTRKLGEGSEGSCFLSSKDNYAYKIMEQSLYDGRISEYNIDKIITTKDISLDCFAMPVELYAVSKELVAYKTKYISPDLFDYYNLMKNYENIYKIHFSTLKQAYEKMLKEAEILSKEQIEIYDLSCNLMFTGKRLVGIDTCAYRRVNQNPHERNLKSINNAIKEVFNSWIMYNPNFEEELVEFIDLEEEIDINNYLNNVSKLTKKVKRRMMYHF